MQGFEYKYKTSDEIFKSIQHIEDFSVVEIGILISICIFIFVVVVIIIPWIHVTKVNFLANKEKKRKKAMLYQISLQREIEEQIEAEIKADEERRLSIQS